MYAVDDRDRVIAITDLPKSSPGAPCPLVLQDEHRAIVAYYRSDHDPGWVGTTVRIVDREASAEPAAIIRFHGVRATMFGPPNDEAFVGHPLAHRGLRPYAAFEVKHSSWIRALARMNAVHPCHRPEHFDALRHIVLAFHDSTFECVARSYDYELCVGPLHALVDRMRARLVRSVNAG